MESHIAAPFILSWLRKQTVTECEEAVPTELVKCRPQEKQTQSYETNQTKVLSE